MIGCSRFPKGKRQDECHVSTVARRRHPRDLSMRSRMPVPTRGGMRRPPPTRGPARPGRRRNELSRRQSPVCASRARPRAMQSRAQTPLPTLCTRYGCVGGVAQCAYRNAQPAHDPRRRRHPAHDALAPLREGDACRAAPRHPAAAPLRPRIGPPAE